MKKLLSVLVMGAVAVSATTAMAAGPSFGFPVSFQGAVPPAPEPMGPGMLPGPGVPIGPPVELFHCVKYKDLDNIAPCAVPLIIQVKDPCACHNPCSCCAPRCVNVKICVPPCGCPPRIKCRKDGEHIEYDYGDYEIDVRVKDGYIEVDYDD